MSGNIANKYDAVEVARRAYLEWYRSFHFLFNLHGSAPRSGPRAPNFDDLIAQGRGIAGSSETVAAFIQQQMDKTGCNYFVGQFAFGDLSLPEMLESVERFGRDVMPKLPALKVRYEEPVIASA